MFFHRIILFFIFISKSYFSNPIFYYHWSFSPRSEGLLLLSLLLLLSKYLIHPSYHSHICKYYKIKHSLYLWLFSHYMKERKLFKSPCHEWNNLEWWSYSLYNIDSIRTTGVLINNAKRSLGHNALTTGQRWGDPTTL